MINTIKSLVQATAEQVKAVMDRYRGAGAIGVDNEGTEFLTQGRSRGGLVVSKVPLYTEKDLQELVEKLGITWDPNFAGRVKRFVASDETVDSYGDIIRQDGWDLKRWKSNPVIMWVHDYHQMNIGTGVKATVNDAHLLIDVLFALAEDYAWSDTVFKMVDRGFLKGNSVGFIPKKISWVEDEKERQKLGLGADGVVFEKQELLEDSICPIGANPSALVQDALEQAVAKGIVDRKELELIKSQSSNKSTRPPEPILETVDKAIDILKGIKHFAAPEEKKVIPFKHYPLAPEDTSWSAGKEVKAADVKDLKLMCTWYDTEHDDTKGAYKLPHHRQADKYTVWRGVSAAMGALLGARGGVDIPDGEKRGVYNHLKKHYVEFEKEVPEFKEYTEDELRSLAEADRIVADNPESVVCGACGVAFDYGEEQEVAMGAVECPSCGAVLNQEGEPVGDGQQKGDKPQGTWKYCVCKSCGYYKSHKAGKPCGYCPDCGKKLVGSDSKPKKEVDSGETIELLNSINSKIDGLTDTTNGLERQVLDIENRTKFIEDTLQERTPDGGGAGQQPKVNAVELADAYLAADKVLDLSKRMKGDS